MTISKEQKIAGGNMYWHDRDHSRKGIDKKARNEVGREEEERQKGEEERLRLDNTIR